MGQRTASPSAAALASDALWRAARAGDLDAAAFALDGGGVVNGRYGDQGNTPLVEAVSNSDAPMAHYLIHRGADVNLQSYSRMYPCGLPPIVEAVRVGNAQMVELLVGHGANVNGRQFYDQTPLDHVPWAGNLNHKDMKGVIAVLRKLGGKTAKELQSDAANIHGATL